MDCLVAERGAPERLQRDNRSEFVSKGMDRWAYENGVTMHFSRLGKPTDNAILLLPPVERLFCDLSSAADLCYWRASYDLP